MTPEQFRSARRTLGEMHGLGRPYTLTEFGRLLRLGGQRPDNSVRDYERGKTSISGPLSLAVELMLGGAYPPKRRSLIVAEGGTIEWSEVQNPGLWK